MKFIKKYRIYIVIFIIAIMILCIVFAFNSFLYPSDSKSVYGNRLEGIENVKIDSNKEMSIVNEIKTNKEIANATMDLKGKTINIVITGKAEFTKDKAKEIANNSLGKFSNEEKSYYDIQFFITNTKDILIGYKNKTTESIVWTEVSEVDENEKQAE